MKLRLTIWALATALVLCATISPAQAQNQNSQPVSPIPPLGSGASASGASSAGAGRGVSQPYDPTPYERGQVLPDNNTLAGAQAFGLGSLEHAHNVFSPTISVSQLGQMAPAVAGQSSLSSQTILNGSLSFDRTWSIFHLTTIYNGGETFFSGTTSSHATFHDLIFTQEMDWERWHLVLRDDFTASPGAAFTGAGMGGPGLIAQFSSMLGSSLTSIGQSFVPNETIETGNAMRYRNSALGQAEYSFSRRSAFTFAGSYGILHFPGTGYIDSHMLNAQAGYDYLLDPMNSIAILAGYGKIDYTGTSGSTVVNGSSTSDYMAALAFGRKITGRLAFQVGGGPEQIRVVNPSANFNLWFLSVNSSLSYQRRRTSLTLSYARGLGAGSGVFLGAKSNTFSGTAQYQFTRFWTGSVNGGYALNNSLAPAGVASTSFNNVFIGGNLGRRLGPHVQINFNYGLQRQGNPVACPVASCGGNGFQQTFGMTLNWHLHPAG